MSARDEILARVRSATADVTTEPRLRAPHHRDAAAEAVMTGARSETLDLFAEYVADYRAEVLRVPVREVPSTIVEALRGVGAGSVVVPTGLDPGWQAAIDDAFEVLPEADATTDQQLDSIDAVVTASRVGIATTGTVVLDHAPDQGRRALTLVPDVHVCVIRDDQVVHDVPEAVARLRPEGGHPPPLTWISGPSATSDIELQRVEGVHGPRTLIVVLVDEGARADVTAG